MRADFVVMAAPAFDDQARNDPLRIFHLDWGSKPSALTRRSSRSAIGHAPSGIGRARAANPAMQFQAPTPLRILPSSCPAKSLLMRLFIDLNSCSSMGRLNAR